MKNKNCDLDLFYWVTLSILSWSTVASACKWTLNYIHPYWMLFFSSLTASLVLFFLILAHPHCSLRTKLSFKWIGLGFINPFLYYLLLFEAYRYSTAQEALVLNYTWVILLALGSALVSKQQLKKPVLLALLLSFAGVWVITSKSWTVLPSLSFGNMLALVSAAVWAGYWIINMRSQGIPLIALFVQFSIASLAILIFSILFIPLPSFFLPKGLLGSIYLGVFEMSLPFFWWLLALKKTSQASTIVQWIYLSPVLSMFWISFFLKEPVRLTSWIGLLLVLGGILLGQASKERSLKNPEV